MTEETSRRWIAGAVVLGTALRLAHVLALRDSPFFAHLVVDPEYYDAWARQIAASDWLGDRAFYMDPLYPYVLAALYRVAGHDLLLARRTMSAPEVSAFWFREAFAHIVSSPAFAARAFLRKAVLFWNDFEISDNQDQYLLERFSWVLVCHRHIGMAGGAP